MNNVAEELKRFNRPHLNFAITTILNILDKLKYERCEVGLFRKNKGVLTDIPYIGLSITRGTGFMLVGNLDEKIGMPFGGDGVPCLREGYIGEGDYVVLKKYTNDEEFFDLLNFFRVNNMIIPSNYMNMWLLKAY